MTTADQKESDDEEDVDRVSDNDSESEASSYGAHHHPNMH